MKSKREPERVLQPWDREDWLELAQTWLNDQFPTASRLEIVHAWEGAFCGVSNVAGQKLHFKALPRELAREAELTPFLRSHSSLLPEVAAVNLEHHWLATWSAGNTHLIREPNLKFWLRALRGLAQLQVDTLPHLELLRAVGCDVLEPEAVFNQARVVLGNSSHEDASAALKRCEHIDIEPLQVLPMALCHGDFHPMNIIVPNTIIDWSDVLITHPFVDLERFLRWLVSTSGKPHHWSPFGDETLAQVPHFIDAYLEPWTIIAPLVALRNAFHATRPFGLLAPLVRNAELATKRGQNLQARFTAVLARF
jgi:hypothetical protein